jgi:hypothetical protein
MATWEERLSDARGFWEVAEAANDREHANQAAANAILAAIAANDAVCLRLRGLRPQGESHIEAVQVLRDVCGGTSWGREAPRRARQLLEVLRHKTAAQYGGRRLPAEQVSRIMHQTERFIAWAQQVCAADTRT